MACNYARINVLSEVAHMEQRARNNKAQAVYRSKNRDAINAKARATYRVKTDAAKAAKVPVDLYVAVDNAVKALTAKRAAKAAYMRRWRARKAEQRAAGVSDAEAHAALWWMFDDVGETYYTNGPTV